MMTCATGSLSLQDALMLVGTTLAAAAWFLAALILARRHGFIAKFEFGLSRCVGRLRQSVGRSAEAFTPSQTSS